MLHICLCKKCQVPTITAEAINKIDVSGVTILFCTSAMKPVFNMRQASDYLAAVDSRPTAAKNVSCRQLGMTTQEIEMCMLANIYNLYWRKIYNLNHTTALWRDTFFNVHFIQFLLFAKLKNIA
jgi:hypothetical protein